MIQFRDNPSLVEILEYLEAVKLKPKSNPSSASELTINSNPNKNNESKVKCNPQGTSESIYVSNPKYNNEPKKINNLTGTSESLNKSNPLSMNENKEKNDGHSGD